jgi:hypothetical protein
MEAKECIERVIAQRRMIGLAQCHIATLDKIDYESRQETKHREKKLTRDQQ